jgi:hypothetical protein
MSFGIQFNIGGQSAQGSYSQAAVGGNQTESAQQQQGGGQNSFKALGLDPTTAMNGAQDIQKYFGGANLQ